MRLLPVNFRRVDGGLVRDHESPSVAIASGRRAAAASDLADRQQRGQWSGSVAGRKGWRRPLLELERRDAIVRRSRAEPERADGEGARTTVRCQPSASSTADHRLRCHRDVVCGAHTATSPSCSSGLSTSRAEQVDDGRLPLPSASASGVPPQRSTGLGSAPAQGGRHHVRLALGRGEVQGGPAVVVGDVRIDPGPTQDADLVHVALARRPAQPEHALDQRPGLPSARGSRFAALAPSDQAVEDVQVVPRHKLAAELDAPHRVPVRSSRGDQTQIPMTSGSPAYSAPDTPLLAGRPIVKANSPE